MRFSFALLAAVAIHAALLVPLAIYFCKSAETGDLEELDVSAVELVLSENALEFPKEVFDELPQVAQLPEEPIVRGEFPRIDIPVVEIVASAPDMETVAAPHADLPSPPKLDMPVPMADVKSSRQVAATEPSPSKVEKKTPPSEVAAGAEKKDVVSLKFKARLPDSPVRLPDGVDLSSLGEKYYPPVARRHGKQGVVRLRLKIDPLGFLDEVRVVEEHKSEIFNDAAIKVVKDIKKFIPAIVEGEAVFSWTELNIEFKLKN